ncbi:MAG: GGDEF and EAL domain-containing protein [Campylobacterales bacterium]|nr:GGDEF and EAL domain-containing protein [Campylobacterales bacterium]
MSIIIKSRVNLYKYILPLITLLLGFSMYLTFDLIQNLQKEYRYSQKLNNQTKMIESILIEGLTNNSALGVILHDNSREDVKDVFMTSKKKIKNLVNYCMTNSQHYYNRYVEQYGAYATTLLQIQKKVAKQQQLTKEEYIRSVEVWKDLKLKLKNISDEILAEQELSAYRFQNFIESLLYKVSILLFLIVFLIVGFYVNIIKYKKVNNQLYFDSLTGLQNRNALLKNIRDYNAKGLMIIDILNFSKINTIYGEKVGDMVLIQVANTLSKIAQKECSVHRLGGDQFTLLNTKHHPIEYCQNNGQKIINEIEKAPMRITVDGEKIDILVNAVIGLARNESGENILENADMALSYGKEHKEPFVIYSDELGVKKHYQDDMQITKFVKKAIEEDRVIPYFQPIIKKDSITYECLVRITDESGKIIPPNDYLDIIKATKYYFDITQIMVEKSINMFKDSEHCFSINLSFQDISNKQLVDFLVDKIKENHIGNRLILEIVESDAIEDFELVKTFTKDIKKLGVRIAIDDFGTGYSNFSNLLDLSPDFIKVDGSLIKDIDNNEKSFRISRTIAEFSKNMDIKVIAEYIHSNEVYDKAKEIGFDGYQGFLLGKPNSTLETTVF